jgi:hypothetical protein
MDQNLTPARRITAECAQRGRDAFVGGLGDALDAVAALRGDEVPRVRAAAERAVVRLTAGSG